MIDVQTKTFVTPKSIETGEDVVLSAVEIGRVRRILFLRRPDNGLAMCTVVMDQREHVERIVGVCYLRPGQLGPLQAAVAKARAACVDLDT
jgi:hypothetical protein